MTQITQPKPKFKVGDIVIHRPDLYGGTESEVKEVTRTYAEIDLPGNFIRDGLRIMESDISSISIPYDFDGETLTVYYPAGRLSPTSFTKVYKFFGYNYVITNSKINSVYPQRNLKLKK